MDNGLIKIIDGLKEVDFVLSDDGYQPESGVRVHLKNAIEYIEHPTPVLPSVEAAASDYLNKEIRSVACDFFWENRRTQIDDYTKMVLTYQNWLSSNPYYQKWLPNIRPGCIEAAIKHLYTDTEFPGKRVRMDGIVEFINDSNLPLTETQTEILLKGIGYWHLCQLALQEQVKKELNEVYSIIIALYEGEETYKNNMEFLYNMAVKSLPELNKK